MGTPKLTDRTSRSQRGGRRSQEAMAWGNANLLKGTSPSSWGTDEKAAQLQCGEQGIKTAPDKSARGP